MRFTGVTSRGIRTPIFQQGDPLIKWTVESIVNASEGEGFPLNDGDIVGVTEAILARTQGNYATVEQIAQDLKDKFGGQDLGIVFPITSRNRFSVLLKALAQASTKLYIQLSYPADEFGNAMLSLDQLDEKGVNPYTDNFNEAEFREVFGFETKHPFTGLDYIEYYKSFGSHIEIIFSNDPKYILNYTKNILVSDVHSRLRTQRIIKEAGEGKVLLLDDILNEPVEGSGYNPVYGLLGSNKATEEKVKLFPKDCEEFVLELQAQLKAKTGKHMEVLVYGDGGFKDPVGGIWELADPVISPAYTEGLEGTPKEIKMKYFADNELAHLSGPALAEAIKQKIKEKSSLDISRSISQGTTPRQITDLLGSLCDLTSGSGDKGTPVVLIQGYFSNYASE